MENSANEANTKNQDRIILLQQRIIDLKKECRDVQFCAYLDMVWNELKNAENTVGQLEKLVETNYQLYQRKNPVQQSYAQPPQYTQAQYVQQQQDIQAQQYMQQIKL